MFSFTMEKRSNFNACERSVFEITRADLSSCDDEDDKKDDKDKDKRQRRRRERQKRVA